MKKKLLLIASVVGLLAALFAACHENGKKRIPLRQLPTGGVEPITIPIDMNTNDTTHVLPFDSWFEVVSAVRLEMTDDNPIGLIGDVVFAKGNIVVADYERAKSITVYDWDGHYLNSISGVGQGPREYVYTRYISTTPDGSFVTITDPQKLMTFDVDGSFIGSVKLPFWNFGTEWLGGETYVQTRSSGLDIRKEGYRPCIVASTPDGDIRFSGIPTDQTEKFNWSFMYYFRKFHQQLFYMPAFNDTIFTIDAKGVTPCYYLDIKRNGTITAEDKVDNDTFREKLKSLSAYFNDDFIDCKDYVLLSLSESEVKWNRFAIYAKDRKETFYCTGRFFKDGRYRFICNLYNSAQWFYYKDNIFGIAVPAYDVLFYKQEMYALCQSDEKLKAEIDRLFDGLTEEDNPVLFFYRIKV